MDKLLKFLDTLDSKHIYYRINKIRESILVEIAVPGERWEVEFFADGEVQIERFISTMEILGESELELLFQNFSD